MTPDGNVSQPSYAARMALTRLDTGYGRELSDSGRIIQPGSQVSGIAELCVAARTTQPGFDLGGGIQPSDAARITLTESVICGGRRLSAVAHNTYQGSRIADGSQTDNVASLLLYIDASTNPLPSDYGFNAASVAAQLQHGHVNPLSKE